MREDWAECRFEELTESLKRGPFGGDLKKAFFVPKGHAIYEQQHAIGNDFSNIRYFIDDERYELLRACNVGPGDYIVSCSGTMGKIARLPKNSPEGVINQALLRIRINEGIINHNYFLEFFRSSIFQKKILKDSRGSGMQNMAGIKEIKPIVVEIPPKPEQRAIVAKIEELFSDLDQGIADLKKAQDQLTIYRQAVLKKAFEGELTKEWREQQTDLPKADELLEQIKEERQKHYEQQLENWKQAVKAWEEKGKEGKKPSKPQKHKEVEELTKAELEELASLPSNWKWIKNNELMYYVTSGSRDWKKFYSDTKGTYFVRTQDIKTNKLDLDGAAFVDLPEHVEGKRSLIEKGDLLMTITGANVGKIAHVDFDISEAYVSQSVALMKYVLKSFSSYLHYYFQSSATGAKFIGAMVYGVGRPVLSLDNMRDAPVSVCSFEEQHQIVQEIESRLSVCDKVEESISESLEKAKALRQSILKKAFEGTLLSQEEIAACKTAPDYEPASVLLEKIKAEKKKA